MGVCARARCVSTDRARLLPVATVINGYFPTLVSRVLSHDVQIALYLRIVRRGSCAGGSHPRWYEQPARLETCRQARGSLDCLQILIQAADSQRGARKAVRSHAVIGRKEQGLLRHHDKPLISVIVPVYKVERQLNRCVDSLVNQTYRNIEVILVDDGSPDACPGICDDWARRDSRITAVHTPNQGLSAARNTGLAKAQGELIAFVDSDDYVDGTFLESLFAALTSHDADIACCGILKEDDLSGRGENATLLADSAVFRTEAMLRDPFFYEWQFVVAWNKLYRRELWDRLAYPVGRLHEDEYVYHHLLKAAHAVAYIPDPLYHYIQREASIMGHASLRRYGDAIGALEDRVDTLKALPHTAHALRRCASSAVWVYGQAIRIAGGGWRFRAQSAGAHLQEVGPADAVVGRFGQGNH